MNKRIVILWLVTIVLLLSSCNRTQMPYKFLSGEKVSVEVESINVQKYDWQVTWYYARLRKPDGSVLTKKFSTSTRGPSPLQKGDVITVYVMKNGELDSPSFYW